MWDQNFEDLLRQRLAFLPADEELTADLPLGDYGLDSMGIVDLMVSLEDAYGVRFVDELLTLETFATPGVLWSALTGLLQPVG